MILTGLDIETTGLHQEKGHRIIEICMKMYDWPSQKVIRVYAQRINPERSIEKGAMAVHGIAEEDLIAEPKWKDVAPVIKEYLQESDIVVAHNGMGFDMPFILNELHRVDVLPTRSAKIVDTMLDGRFACASGKVPNLGELCFALDVDYDPENAHAADYDVDVMMQAYFNGLKIGAFKMPVIKSKEAA